MITPNQVNDYQKNGAVFLPGLFSDWVSTIRDGIERNMGEPGEYASENLQKHESGRFFVLQGGIKPEFPSSLHRQLFRHHNPPQFQQ